MSAPPQIPRDLYDRVLLAAEGPSVDLGCGQGSSVDPGSTVSLAEIARGPLLQIDLRNHPGRGHPSALRVRASFDAPLPLGNHAFSLVVCNHVAEHVASPTLLLSEIARVLDPAGMAILAIPNGRSFSDRAFRLWYWLHHRPSDDDYDPHRQVFTQESFEELLRANGLAVLHTARIGESYSWLRKHPRVRSIATRLTRRLSCVAPERSSYGWHYIVERITEADKTG